MRTASRFTSPRAIAWNATLLLLLGTFHAESARASAPGVSTPLSHTLPNGMRVVVFPIHRLPIVQVELVVPAGQAAEAPGNDGVAQLTAALLPRGTSSRDAASFASDAARMGATISARASRDMAAVNGGFLASDLGAGMELISDAVINPVFDDAELQLERARNQSALRQMRSDPVALAEEQLWSAAFGDRRYGRSPFGSDSALARLTRDDLRVFHRDHYRPDHALLVVAGDVNPDTVFALATEWFGRWSGRAIATRAAEPPAARERVRIVDVPDASYSVVRLGIVVPGLRDDASLPLSLAASRFSGGAFSWLQQPAVRRRLGPLVSGGLTSYADAGLFSFGTPVTTDSVGSVVRLLRDVLRQYVSHSPARSEIETIRLAGQTGFLASLETLGGVIGSWSSMALDGRSDDVLRRTDARLAGMNAAEIEGAGSRWLVADSVVIVAVGPARALEPQLSAFGRVRVVSLPSAPPPAPPDTAVVTETSVARAHEVIAAALIAHGGEDSLRAIHDSIVHLAVSVGAVGSATSGEMIQVRKEPGRFSTTIRIEEIETRQVLNVNQGWSITTGVTGVKDLDDSQLAGLRTSYLADLPHLLLGLGRAGLRIASRGVGKIDQQETDVIEIYTPEGIWQRYSFDAHSHLLAGIDSFEGLPRPGGQVLSRHYGAYEINAGVRWPFREIRLINGRSTMRIETRSLAVNSAVPDRQFERPNVAGR